MLKEFNALGLTPAENPFGEAFSNLHIRKLSLLRDKGISHYYCLFREVWIFIDPEKYRKIKYSNPEIDTKTIQRTKKRAEADAKGIEMIQFMASKAMAFQAMKDAKVKAERNTLCKWEYGKSVGKLSLVILIVLLAGNIFLSHLFRTNENCGLKDVIFFEDVAKLTGMVAAASIIAVGLEELFHKLFDKPLR